MINGFFNVFKEAGYTSHDVVAIVRRLAHQKKVGHTGTLDPAAEGVLPVCLGKATRAAALLSDHDKTYEAVLRLGVETDTQDLTGEVLASVSEECVCALSEDRIREVCTSFLGDQMQIPPMYSAKKVDGKKLYELAREGKVVERKPCPIRIAAIEVLAVELPCIRLRVTCSAGTYIRTLCHDIGAKLGTGGAMEYLKRTKVGVFSEETAVSLAELQKRSEEGTLSEAVLPVDGIFLDCQGVVIGEKAEKLLYNGCPVPVSAEVQRISPKDESGGQNTHTRVYDRTGRFIGIYRRTGRDLVPERILFDREEFLKEQAEQDLKES